MKFMPVVCLAIVAVNSCLVSATQIVDLDDVDPKLEAELRKLTPEFAKLSKILKDHGIQHEIDDEHSGKPFLIARRLLKETSTGCLGLGCLVRSPWAKALELFIGLESTRGKCDTKSHEILMKNYIAIEMGSKSADVSEAQKVLDFYRQKHFFSCRNYHKLMFSLSSSQMQQGALAKVKKAFRSLDVPRLIPPESSDRFHGDYKDLIDMPNPQFSQSEEAQQELARQVLAQVKAHSLQGGAEIKSDAKSLKKYFNEYLFEPCKVYRDELGAMLTEARFDATYNFFEGAQEEFVRRNEQFYRGLINNRLCRVLLEERKKLQESLGKAWKVVLNEA